MADNARVVYSTGAGRLCPDCGEPRDACRCDTTAATAAIPRRITAKLRMERSGRGGKTVTVIDGLPDNGAFLKGLCQELKRVCGTGGAVVSGGIELQGDLRDRVRPVLAAKGYLVKG